MYPLKVYSILLERDIALFYYSTIIKSVHSSVLTLELIIDLIR